ncbi:MAG TPA: chromate efflux transporter [Sphingobacteriaceae bacterium]|nr:chromate efflux transporter [Sphingobacteriaceae bacterium]
MSKRQFLFLSDVLWLTFTAFGGPQAHIAMMVRNMVNKRHYISEAELLELNALTQVLPGPSSTQTLVGIAYKVGGLSLSLITFIIWITPSAVIMTFAAISYSLLDEKDKFNNILFYIQPIAVGIVAYATYLLAKSVLKHKTAIWLAVASIIATLILRNAYVFPILILLGGIISSALESPIEESELRFRLFKNINTKKVIYFLGILLLFALLGAIINKTSPFSLPIRLFENFYRNGIIIFGGGQVLVPLMFTEFVEMKHYLTAQEFLTGYALQQAIPGPTFSFTSFLGGITLKNYGYGIPGQILGSFVAVLGINLPGLILILFIVPFWNDLKKITRIKNSLSGINAVSVGFLGATFVLLANQISFHVISISTIFITFILLVFTRVKTPLLIVAGVLLGLLL